MANIRDNLTQKELEKFINIGGTWGVRVVMHDIWNTLNEITSGTDTYVGYQNVGGDWMIKYIDTSNGNSIRFATIKNNTSTVDYTTAWSNRDSLTYGLFSDAFPNT